MVVSVCWTGIPLNCETGRGEWKYGIGFTHGTWDGMGLEHGTVQH